MIDLFTIGRYAVGIIGAFIFCAIGGTFWGNAISQYKSGKFGTAGCSITLGLAFMVLMTRVLWGL